MMTGCVTRRNDVGTRHRNEWHLNSKDWVKLRSWRATYICLHRKEHRWIHRMRSRHRLLVLMIGCRRLLRHAIHSWPRGSWRWCDRQIIGWIVGWWTCATMVILQPLLIYGRICYLLFNEGILCFLYAGAKTIWRFWNVNGAIACCRRTSNAVFSLTNEMNAKCLNLHGHASRSRFSTVVVDLRVFFGDDFHIMNRTEGLKMKFDLGTGGLRWSETEKWRDERKLLNLTSRGKFFIKRRLAINWLCRGILASFNLLIKFRCSWLGNLAPVDRWGSIEDKWRRRRRKRRNRLLQ